MATIRNAIPEEVLIKLGFKKTEGANQYKLIIDFQYNGNRSIVGERFIVSNTTTNGWFCWYDVNGIPASKGLHTEKEVKELYSALTGKALPNN